MDRNLLYYPFCFFLERLREAVPLKLMHFNTTVGVEESAFCSQIGIKFSKPYATSFKAELVKMCPSLLRCQRQFKATFHFNRHQRGVCKDQRCSSVSKTIRSNSCDHDNGSSCGNLFPGRQEPRRDRVMGDRRFLLHPRHRASGKIIIDQAASPLIGRKTRGEIKPSPKRDCDDQKPRSLATRRGGHARAS